MLIVSKVSLLMLECKSNYLFLHEKKVLYPLLLKYVFTIIKKKPSNRRSRIQFERKLWSHQICLKSYIRGDQKRLFLKLNLLEEQ